MPERTVFLRLPSQFSLRDIIGAGDTLVHPLSTNGTCADQELQPSVLVRALPEDPTVICGRCNQTHVVMYMTGVAREMDRPVFELLDYEYVEGRPNRNKERVAARDGVSKKVLLFKEPPPHLGFESVAVSRGFSAYASYQRAADVWLPLATPSLLASRYWEQYAGREEDAWEHTRAQRSSVGIWHDNCKSRLRTPVMDALLNRSTLDVLSYGRCRNNVHGARSPAAARDDRGSASGGPTDSNFPRLNSPEGQRLCQGHRLMLAVENHACVDWVSPNLAHALSCGAIPIVLSVSDSWACAPACNSSVFFAYAAGQTCGERMKWLLSPLGGSHASLDACELVADEFPTECGACRPVRGPSARAPLGAPTSKAGARASTPDYESLFGPLPRVDAASAGWLAEVERLMSDDDYYRAALRRLAVWAHPHHGLWRRGVHSGAGRHAHMSSPHCLWFDDERFAIKELRWPGCAT